MTDKRISQIRIGILSAVLLVSGFLYLWLPFLAIRWAQKPFAGFFFDTNLVINGNVGVEQWPAKQLSPPINHPDRLVAVDGQTINSLEQWNALIAARAVGDEITLTLVRPPGNKDGQSAFVRSVTIPLIAFSNKDLIALFWVPYLIGFVTLLIGAWTFRIRPEAEAAQIFALFTLAMAWAIGAIFEATTTQLFIRGWLTAVIFGGILNLVLASVFPHEISFVRRWHPIKWLVVVPAVLVFIWAQLWLHDAARPWAYVTTWRAAYYLSGTALLLSIALMAYRGFLSKSPLVQQQGRTILIGATIAFIPICFWLFDSSSSPFRAIVFLPPLMVYPLTIGYTIVRYRLLDVDVMLRQGITYTALSTVLALFFLSVISLLSNLLGPAVTLDSPILLALFVLTLIVVFNPVRDRLERAVDRLFFRKPVEFNELLRRYNRELTTAVNVEQFSAVLLRYASAGAPGSEARLYLPDSQMTSYSSYPNGNGLPLDAASPFVSFMQRDPGAVYLAEERVWPAELRAHRQDVLALNAAVAIPMINTQTLLGLLVLSDKENGQSFSRAEINYLNALAEQSLIGLERVNVIRRLEERVAELDMLSQFSQALNFTITFDDLLELVYTNCQRLLDICDFYISLRDLETQQIYSAFHLEDDERVKEREGSHLPVEHERVHQVILTGQMVVAEDEHGRAWMGAPLNAGAETLGALHTFYRQPGRRFSHRQQQLFSVYADRFATILDRWQAGQQLKTRAQQLEALNEVISSLTATLDINALLELVLDKSMELLETEAGTFMLMVEDTGELEFRVARGPSSANLIGTRLPVGTGLAGTVAQTGRPILVNDVQRDTRWFSGIDASSEFITQAILTVPLLRGREVIGVLQVINKRNRAPFNEDDRALLTALAGQAAVALENARLLHQTDVALQERVNELSLLQQLGRDLNMILDLPAVLDLTLNWILRICDGTAGAIVLVEEDNRLTIAATHGYDKSFDPEQFDDETLQLSLVGEVSQSGKPHVTGDVHLHPNYVAAAFATRSQMTVPILHKQGVVGVIAIESDRPNAFNEKHLETAVRVTNHAAVAIANALLYAQVIEANDAKSDFVSMVSHELRTPMTSIRGYTELLLTGLSGELTLQQQNFLETVAANSRRVNTLLSDLTDISRIETGHLNINLSPMPFANVVSETLPTIQGLCDEKGIELHLDMPAELPLIMGDQSRLVQVLTNLISNACKYSPSDSNVYVSVRTEDIATREGKPAQPMLVCAVRDTGYGISVEDQARLFTKFFRAHDPNVRQSSGTGLGLSITKGIVELHGGRIWFESQVGEGTTFYFAIPLAD